MGKKAWIISAAIVFILIVIVVIFFLGQAPNSKPVNPSSTGTTSASTSQTPANGLRTIPRTNSYAINTPNALILIDSQGRRTGKDPITGTLYHEIPNTSYSEEGASGQLYFFTPLVGKYELYILGGATGQYHLDAWVDGGNGSPTPIPQRISGNIDKGSMIVYIQNYDPANIASSSVFFSNTVSSTISITSAPAHNLPPPPIP